MLISCSEHKKINWKDDHTLSEGNPLINPTTSPRVGELLDLSPWSQTLASVITDILPPA